MKLLNMTRTRSGTHVTDAMSLEDLWNEANDIGSVRVNNSIIPTPHEVEITFKLPSGSRIQARGNDTDFYTALQKAIAEARRFKGAKG